MTAPGDFYTHGHHESVLRSHRWRTAQNSAGYLMPLLKPGMSLLDVGCGPGTISIDLAALLAPGLVTAIDVAEDVLETARATAVACGASTIDFAVGDVYALDFPDDTFDVVHAHQLLQHLGDPVAALREMGRVCKPGGIVAVRDSDYAGFTWFPLSAELDAWLALYRSVARTNRGEPDAGRRLPAWARAAGLREVTANSSTWCFATPEERAWWGGMWADRIVRSDIARQAVASGAATEAELRGMSDAWRAWAEHEDGWISILHGEVLARA